MQIAKLWGADLVCYRFFSRLSLKGTDLEQSFARSVVRRQSAGDLGCVALRDIKLVRPQSRSVYS